MLSHSFYLIIIFSQDVSKDALEQQLQLTVSQVSPIASSSHTSLSVLSSAVSTSAPYLLESGDVQVGAEEVVSEEVVTDEPVVVLESTGEQVDLSKNIVDGLQTLSSKSSCNLHEKEIIHSSSSSTTELPLAKIPALDLAVTNSVMSLDSSGGHFSDVNLLTTLANSHFVTETSNSDNSSHIPLITSSVEQLIQTSLSAVASSSPESDLAIATSNIADQVLVPTSTDRMTVNQGGMVEVEATHVNESTCSNVAVESEVVIDEPMILNIVSEGGVNMEEEVVTLLLENQGAEKQEDEKQRELEDILLDDVDTHGEAN